MPPVSRLFLPPTGLASCLFAAIYRDTRGARLSPQDRYNHFPASPLVSVTRVIHGQLHVAKGANPSDTSAPLPALSVMGPQDGPVTSWSPGEVTAVTLGLYHDSWVLLGGDPEFRHVPPALAQALNRFGTAPSLRQGWNDVCAVLAPLWADQRPKTWGRSSSISDWAQGVITRTALAGPGRSLRALERRLKRQSGHTRRSLDFYAAFETLHAVVQNSPNATLAEIAYAAGYADQSHMGRAVRRATGFTPARLNHAIQTQEPFWCYRLLGERF